MRKQLQTLIVLVGALVMLPLSHAGWQEGVEAYNAGDFTLALKEFKVLADEGLDSAQYNLGMMLAKGQGVPKDEKKIGRASCRERV